MIMENMEDGQEIEVADKSRTRGIIDMPTTVQDTPRVGGLKAVPETDDRRLWQTVGITAGKATKRASAGRKRPIQTNPDQVELNRQISNDHTMRRA